MKPKGTALNSRVQHTAGGCKRLGRINVEACRRAKFHVDDLQRRRLNDLAGSRVAFQLVHLQEERARQDDRVAALAAMGGTDNRLAASLKESYDKGVKITGREARHAGKRDKSTGYGWRKRTNAEFQRARQAVGEIRI